MEGSRNLNSNLHRDKHIRGERNEWYSGKLVCDVLMTPYRKRGAEGNKGGELYIEYLCES